MVFYNAYREDTQLFITHRNVDRLDFTLHDVPIEDFVSQIAGDNYYNAAETYAQRSDRLLRQWSLEANVPENALRYDLITLDPNQVVDTADGSGTVIGSCPGSLPTRLNVGDTAIVISDPDPLRARQSPPSGEIVELLYRDYSLPVVGGPVCANDLLWWEVELRDQRRVWIAESVGDEYFVDVQFEGGTTGIDFVEDTTQGDLPAGVYFLTANAPNSENPPLRHFALVATANLTVKADIDSMLVWATDVETGQPIPNVPVTIYNNTFEVQGSGITNANGVVDIDTTDVTDLYQRRVAVLQTDNHFGIGMTEWTNGIEPYQFGQFYDFYPRQNHVYMYTDRPIYRPDQPVYFRGIIRKKDDVQYTLTNLKQYPFKFLMTAVK